MATHSSVPAWRIPGTEEPGGLPSMGSHRVRYDSSSLATAAAAIQQVIFFKSRNPTYMAFLFLDFLTDRLSTLRSTMVGKRACISCLGHIPVLGR